MGPSRVSGAARRHGSTAVLRTGAAGGTLRTRPPTEPTVPTLAPRDWVPADAERRVQALATDAATATTADVLDRIDRLVARNRAIHEVECFNLNPATNVLNPRAEAVLSAGLGSRPSLGYPGAKYETGLEAIEEIEVIAAELAAQVFGARFAEVRVASGSIANLYAFVATCEPGDAIIAPPASVGGHVTHHDDGAAGLYGLTVHHAPVDADGYTVDVEALGALARRVRPRLITLGGSLNLFEHPVAEVRAVADEVGARVLVDAAHQCGMLAGGAWADPLAAGADLVTMSTYKSLGGPAGGLLVTDDPTLAERVDRIAHPGLTANFDAAKTAALAITMVDWLTHGRAYAASMVAVARSLVDHLLAADVPVFAAARGGTTSHQFAVEAAPFGGGQAVSQHLRRAGFLTCGIGLPLPPVAGDLNGLRIGTPELCRWGVGVEDVPELADLLVRALRSDDPASLALAVTALRARFDTVHFVVD